MNKRFNNYAFIDSQNLYLGVKKLGWSLDFGKFRIYLKEKYQVTTAYLFLGYLSGNRDLYQRMIRLGYALIFKPIIKNHDGQIKGNVDAELVLQAVIDMPKYHQAVIVSSDGDFYCLVKYLKERNKLKLVISPDIKNCSILLKKAAQGKIDVFDKLQKKLEYKRKSAA